MTDLTAEKTYMVSAEIAPGTPPHFFGGDGISVDLARLSPVEQLLGAVCSCFGQSCAAVMDFHGLPVSSLHVACDGHKPAGPVMGKGLDRLKLVVRFSEPLDEAKRNRVLGDTKKVCTVTNSLSKDLVIEVFSSAGGEG